MRERYNCVIARTHSPFWTLSRWKKEGLGHVTQETATDLGTLPQICREVAAHYPGNSNSKWRRLLLEGRRSYGNTSLIVRTRRHDPPLHLGQIDPSAVRDAFRIETPGMRSDPRSTTRRSLARRVSSSRSRYTRCRKSENVIVNY